MNTIERTTTIEYQRMMHRVMYAVSRNVTPVFREDRMDRMSAMTMLSVLMDIERIKNAHATSAYSSTFERTPLTTKMELFQASRFFSTRKHSKTRKRMVAEWYEVTFSTPFPSLTPCLSSIPSNMILESRSSFSTRSTLKVVQWSHRSQSRMAWIFSDVSCCAR